MIENRCRCRPPLVFGETRFSRALSALTLLVHTFACAGPPIDDISPTQTAMIVAPNVAPDLKEAEGLLIVNVDTDVPLAALEATGFTIASAVSAGRYAWVVQVPSGRYAWSGIAFDPKGLPEHGYCPRKRVYRLDPRSRRLEHRPEEFDFDVKPGVLNYPGELVIRGAKGVYCGSHPGVSIRNRNHSAMALRSLEKTHSSLIDRIELRYSGASDDGFLEFFSRERAQLIAAPIEEDQ